MKIEQYGNSSISLIKQKKSFFNDNKKSQCSRKIRNVFQDMITPLIDSMQFELDKKYASSEVHVLLKRK